MGYKHANNARLGHCHQPYLCWYILIVIGKLVYPAYHLSRYTFNFSIDSTSNTKFPAVKIAVELYLHAAVAGGQQLVSCPVMNQTIAILNGC